MSTITMDKLTSGMCRWPFGNPEDKDFYFCGNPCNSDSSYCEEHMMKALAPTRKPKA